MHSHVAVTANIASTTWLGKLPLCTHSVSMTQWLEYLLLCAGWSPGEVLSDSVSKCVLSDGGSAARQAALPGRQKAEPGSRCQS